MLLPVAFSEGDVTGLGRGFVFYDNGDERSCNQECAECHEGTCESGNETHRLLVGIFLLPPAGALDLFLSGWT